MVLIANIKWYQSRGSIYSQEIEPRKKSKGHRARPIKLVGSGQVGGDESSREQAKIKSEVVKLKGAA